MLTRRVASAVSSPANDLMRASTSATVTEPYRPARHPGRDCRHDRGAAGRQPYPTAAPAAVFGNARVAPALFDAGVVVTRSAAQNAS